METLQGKDRSRQGFIDKDIRKLIGILNSKGYETTSSCSGRIVLLQLPEFGDKRNSEWLFKTHAKADDREILKVLKKSKGRLYFLQEPPIIHVNCGNAEKAGRLLNIAMKAGFKHSGLTSFRKFSVEIRGSERLETPLENASEDFVRMLVNEANKKLNRCKDNLKKLECSISSL